MVIGVMFTNLAFSFTGAPACRYLQLGFLEWRMFLQVLDKSFHGGFHKWDGYNLSYVILVIIIYIYIIICIYIYNVYMYMEVSTNWGYPNSQQLDTLEWRILY